MNRKYKDSDHHKKHNKHCHKNGSSTSNSLNKHSFPKKDKHHSKYLNHKKDDEHHHFEYHENKYSKKNEYFLQENGKVEDRRHDRKFHKNRPFQENGRLDDRNDFRKMEERSRDDRKNDNVKSSSRDSKRSDERKHRSYNEDCHSSRENEKSEEKKKKSRKHEEGKPRSQKSNETEESYEELSRKKRRIESELHALDLEEAAEAEKQRKAERKASSQSKKKEVVEVKQELTSSPERQQKSKIKSIKPTALIKEERKQQKVSKQKDEQWGKNEVKPGKEVKDKVKPNFEVSGKLAEDTNTYNGVVIKYNEPSEARKPKRRWRLYPFKGDTDLPFIPIHRQSAYLFGRTRSIADIPIDHPSCSKQHAVLQYRLIPYKREDGSTGRRVRPYIIDLESSNGTFVNNKKVEARCYVELMEKDVVKFGFSSREYVILHEESRDEELEDEGLESNEERDP